MIGFTEAYRLTIETIQPLEVETVPLLDAVRRVVARDLQSPIASPSVEVSFKDGYALRSEDILSASPDHPVRLHLVGTIAAGGTWQRDVLPGAAANNLRDGLVPAGTTWSDAAADLPGSAPLLPGAIHPGEAVRILSGALLPPGADAILAEEFACVEPGVVLALNQAEPGRNILPRGADVQDGQLLVQAGQRLMPPTIGLLAAAGYAAVPVYRQPRVAILATGDEILAPGQPLQPGKLYASNLCTLAAWCLSYGFDAESFVVRDDAETIRHALVDCLGRCDALLTSGGAWKGERDLVVHILDALGWQKSYHRIRMGPGKAVGYGLYQDKPVFILPGGPPSNHMAFLQLALPGLHRLAGYAQPGLPSLPAVLASTISGQIDWTQFRHGRLEADAGRLLFTPLVYQSRLVEMAHTDAITQIPEGVEQIPAGSPIMVQLLHLSSI